MKYTDDINIFKLNKDFTAEIDITGTFGHIYHYPQRMNGCLFILCLRGECDITIHLSEHKIQKNDIVTILPETFVHVHRQSPGLPSILGRIQQRTAEWNKLFQFYQELSFRP